MLGYRCILTQTYLNVLCVDSRVWTLSILSPIPSLSPNLLPSRPSGGSSGRDKELQPGTGSGSGDVPDGEEEFTITRKPARQFILESLPQLYCWHGLSPLSLTKNPPPPLGDKVGRDDYGLTGRLVHSRRGRTY